MGENDSRVRGLVARWERAALGQKPTIEELCAACPELASQVARLIEQTAALESSSTSSQTKPLDQRETATSPAPPPVRRPETSRAAVLPRRIGRYRILGVLGEGGMGAVYRAEQDAPRREVALKVIKPGIAGPGTLQRFRFEAEVLGRLEHSAIARIYEAGTANAGAGPQPFFAMEMVDGPPLTRYADGAGLDVRGRLELVGEVCDAIQHAHQKGVVHRDLKPSNILVTPDGQPKVLDFGVARVIDEAAAETMHTQSGQVVGTLPYMSPEQASGQVDQIDTRSDVYTLGVITYELLTGRLPHDLEGKPLPSAVRMICDDSPARLSTIDASLRGDVETIVAKAMAKEKSRRYATVGEFAADIRRYLRYEPITARPASGWYQMSKFARRHRTAVIGAIAVVVCLAVGTIVSSLLAFRATWALGQANQGKLAAMAAETRAQGEQAKAERRLREQQRLLTRVMFDVNDSIQSLPGADKARVLLVRSTADALEKMAADAVDDTSVQSDLSMALLKVGDVQRNLGMTAEALTTHRRALEIRQRLARRVPNDAKAEWDRIFSLERVAGIEAATGDTDRARATYRELQDAAANQTSKANAAALAFRMLGEARTELGDLAGALTAYRAGLQVAEQLDKQRPNDRNVRHDLMTSRWGVANAELKLGHRPQALEQFRLSLVIAQELATDSNDTWTASDLATLRARVAELSAKPDDPSAHLTIATSKLTLARNQLARTPDEPGARAAVADALREVADLEWVAGRGVEARAHLREFVDLDLPRARAAPNGDEGPLRSALVKLIMADHAARDFESVVKSGRMLLELSNLLLGRRSDTPVDVLRSAGVAQDWIAVALSALGKPAESQSAYEEAVRIRKKVASLPGASENDIRPLYETWTRMATDQLNTGHVDQARATLTQAVAAMQALLLVAEESPSGNTVAELARARAGLRGTLGETFVKSGDAGGALGIYRDALCELSVVRSAYPRSPELLEAAGDLNYRAGFLAANEKHNEQALEYFRESLNCRQRRFELVVRPTTGPTAELHARLRRLDLDMLRLMNHMVSDYTVAVGRTEEALEPLEKSIAIGHDLLAAGDARMHGPLVDDWGRLADLRWQLARHSESLDAADHALALSTADEDRSAALIAARFAERCAMAAIDPKLPPNERSKLLSKASEYCSAFNARLKRFRTSAAIPQDVQPWIDRVDHAIKTMTTGQRN